MGGDEFVILCEDITDDAQLDVIVSHIMGAFADPVVLPDRQLWVSVSAGVVSGDASSVGDATAQPSRRRHVPGQGTRPAASAATTPRRVRTSRRRRRGSRLLRLALERHQLLPYYQPIVDLHSGTIVAVEALARWEDPDRGLLEAKDFIPLAEELGLVGEISELVLATGRPSLDGLGPTGARPEGDRQRVAPPVARLEVGADRAQARRPMASTLPTWSWR